MILIRFAGRECVVTASKLLQHPNGKWYVHYCEGRRSKRFSTGTSDYDAAAAAHARWILGVSQKLPNVSRPKTIRRKREAAFNEFWHSYRSGHVEENVASKETIDFVWNNLRLMFAGVTLSGMSQTLIDRYVALRCTGRIGRPAKAATVRRELQSLMAAINWCAFRGLHGSKPDAVPQFVLPPESPPRGRWLTEAEINLLLQAAEDTRGPGDKLSRIELFIWIALQTGARKSAILDLTWDRVHLDVGVIHFDIPGRRQTKKRRAAVPISDALRGVLERASRERVNELVLMNKGEVWASLQRLAVRAGLSPPTNRAHDAKPLASGISPNVLRHTAATHMARAGTPLWKIAKVLGNSQQMVERVYAKWVPADLKDAVNSIPSRPPD